jgi:hypothetical protein
MKQTVVAIAVLAVAMSAFAEDPGKGDDSASNTGALGVRATGGPDGFGYTYIDSTEPGGPTYSFVDISGTGTALGLSDDGEANIAVGFSFPFYGASYSDVRVGNNGGILITTASDNLWAGNSCPLPTVDSPERFVLPFWDDLDTEQGDVYYETFAACPNTAGGTGQCLVVQWEDRPHFSGTSNPDPVTFQAILYDTGLMLFQYEDVSFSNALYDNGASASVGIQGNSSDYFLEYSCNAANLSDGLAILFSITPYEPPDRGIPTLSTWGIALLLLAMAGVAVIRLRR